MNNIVKRNSPPRVFIALYFEITEMKECHYCLGMTSVGVRMLICFVSMYHCFSTIISVNKSHDNKFYIWKKKNKHHTRKHAYWKSAYIYVKESERMTMTMHSWGKWKNELSADLYKFLFAKINYRSPWSIVAVIRSPWSIVAVIFSLSKSILDRRKNIVEVIFSSLKSVLYGRKTSPK